MTKSHSTSPSSMVAMALKSSAGSAMAAVNLDIPATISSLTTRIRPRMYPRMIVPKVYEEKAQAVRVG